MNLRGFVTLLLLSSLAVACSEAPKDDRSRRHHIFELARGPEGGSYAFPVRNITEALPGAYPFDDNVSISDIVVVGAVTRVEPGSGFVVDEGTDSPVPFDDNSAQGRYVRVTLHVEEALCATTEFLDANVEFRFGITPLDDLEDIRQGFGAMGTIVVFLSRGEAVPGVYQNAALPGLLGEVTSTGGLSFKAAEEEFGSEWLDGGRTVAQLKKACPA